MFLQIRREGLKVEIDSDEHWMKDVPIDSGELKIGPLNVRILRLDPLIELYRRGELATRRDSQQGATAKHDHIAYLLGRLTRLSSAAP
jgi:hypothetical protein